MSGKILLETQYWESECGGGCCYDWGEYLYVNGKPVTVYSNDVNVGTLTSVLEHLGYEVEHKYREGETEESE